MSDCIVHLVKEIRQERRKQNKTQDMMAEATGISRTHITRIEGNKVENPSLEILEKLADSLGCNLKITLCKKTTTLIRNEGA